jgi:hypothetical protein
MEVRSRRPSDRYCRIIEGGARRCQLVWNVGGVYIADWREETGTKDVDSSILKDVSHARN